MLSAQPVNILLVDDQIENLLTLEAVLGDLGYNLVRADSANDALRFLLDNEFAVILLDVNMPGINGFETATLIRQRESSKYTPIIFLTAMYTEDADIAMAYSLGAVDFMIKPFVPEVLRTKVSVFCELFKKTEQVKRQSELIVEIENKRIQEESERLAIARQRLAEELRRKEVEKQLLEEHSLQLQKADKLKTEFLANMSHEIRTPMNGVIGMAELLLNTSLTNEQREFAQIIRESAQALLIIINDILDLSKIEAGRLELETIDFSLVGLVEGTAELLAESARAKQLNVMTYVEPGVPVYMKGDPGRLRQVLMNLTGNALKFTDRGEVVVQVEKVDDYISTTHGAAIATVRFTVSDTGIGLSQDVMDRLFRPFSQADGSTTRRFGGTGLGLSISKRLVELMGGQIGVTSNPGEGSTFWFTVPLEIARTSENPYLPADDCKDARILILDAQKSARSILQAYINTWGMHCDSVSTVTEALDRLLSAANAQQPYDIVVTDLLLPEMGGLRLLDRVKESDELCDLKVVLCTGFEAKQQSERALQMGFSAFLSKPVQQSRLFNCIMNLLRKESHSSEAGEALSLRRMQMEHERIVLLAEDNVVNQKVAMLQLKQLGMKGVAVNNGKEAVEEVLRGVYDIILMDCQMPEMDGFEATKAIRQAESLLGRHTPIIGLTAHAMEGDRDRCIRAGMDDYLSKPTSLEKLARMIGKRLQSKDETDHEIDFAIYPSLIPVLNQEMMAELIPVFISTTASSIDLLRDQLEAQNMKEVASLSHEMESACLGIGARRIGAVSNEITLRAVANEPARIQGLLNQLTLAFDCFKNGVEVSMQLHSDR